MTPSPRRKSKTASELPQAELEVMACLWEGGPATARQIRETMHDYRPMAHGSVMVLLGRLESKGWVGREKAPRGKAFIYSPTHRPGPTHRRLLDELVQRIFAGKSLAVVSTLFDAAPPTETELDELQQLLDRLRRQKREGGDGV